MLLEVCIDNIESARAAFKGGCHRLEVCGDLTIGGVTPDYKFIKQIEAEMDLPLMVMVRPRGGDFVYTADEFSMMKVTILELKKMEVAGVVFGLLDREGYVDRNRTAELVELSKPLSVTYHRAFDECQKPLEALNFLKSIGVDRVLTSGQQPTAVEGVPLLKKLIRHAGDDIIILPGSGVSAQDISYLIQETKAKEYHGSFKGEGSQTSAQSVAAAIKILTA